MDFKHPEVVRLAQRVFGIELVLRGMCSAMPPEQRAALLRVIDLYRDISLFGETQDAHREAIMLAARRLVAAPDDEAPPPVR